MYSKIPVIMAPPVYRLLKAACFSRTALMTNTWAPSSRMSAHTMMSAFWLSGRFRRDINRGRRLKIIPKELQDDHDIVFTQGDLNVLIKVLGVYIVAVLDWALAWRPAYWEYVKYMHCMGGYDTEWEESEVRELQRLELKESIDSHGIILRLDSSNQVHLRDALGVVHATDFYQLHWSSITVLHINAWRHGTTSRTC